jgi:hypothetical protein
MAIRDEPWGARTPTLIDDTRFPAKLPTPLSTIPTANREHRTSKSYGKPRDQLSEMVEIFADASAQHAQSIAMKNRSIQASTSAFARRSTRSPQGLGRLGPYQAVGP